MTGGYGDNLPLYARNLSIVMAEARDKEKVYPLRRFFPERGVPVPELQQAIVELVQRGT